MRDNRLHGAPRAGIGTTALGRILVSEVQPDGVEDITHERRWPTMDLARAWCERTVAAVSETGTVLEVQVYEERWQHARSWDVGSSHPVPHALQLGIVTGDGMRWSQPTPYQPRMSTRDR